MKISLLTFWQITIYVEITSVDISRHEITESKVQTPSINSSSFRPSMDALIDMKFITADCMLSDKWIYRLISQERFPRPIKLGRMSRWRAADYYSWRDGLENTSSIEYENSRLKANKIREGNPQGINGRH